MFSDIYKMKEVCNGICFEVDGKVISRREGDIDDALIGGNASAECLDEGGEGTTISGVDIVMNHHLNETSFTKDSFKQYIKDYMKALKAYLEKNKPDRVKPFMTGASEKVKELLGNFKNLQFFTGESMNPEGMVGFLDYREDGITPYMTFFKDGLEIEKC